MFYGSGDRDPHPLTGAPTREGVFLHAADPVVLDCPEDLSISLLATANYHFWDLSTDGMPSLPTAEFGEARLTRETAGVGRHTLSER